MTTESLLTTQLNKLFRKKDDYSEIKKEVEIEVSDENMEETSSISENKRIHVKSEFELNDNNNVVNNGWDDAEIHIDEIFTSSMTPIEEMADTSLTTAAHNNTQNMTPHPQKVYLDGIVGEYMTKIETFIILNSEKLNYLENKTSNFFLRQLQDVLKIIYTDVHNENMHKLASSILILFHKSDILKYQMVNRSRKNDSLMNYYANITFDSPSSGMLFGAVTYLKYENNANLWNCLSYKLKPNTPKYIIARRNLIMNALKLDDNFESSISNGLDANTNLQFIYALRDCKMNINMLDRSNRSTFLVS